MFRYQRFLTSVMNTKSQMRANLVAKHTLVDDPQRERVVRVFQRFSRHLFDQQVDGAVTSGSGHAGSREHVD